MSAMSPEGSAVITPMMMYNTIGEIKEQVNKLNALLDPTLTDVKHDIADHEVRLRGLEKRVSIAIGGALILQVAIGLLVTFYK